MKKIKTSTRQKILLFMFSIVLTLIIIELGFGKGIFELSFFISNLITGNLVQNNNNIMIVVLGESTSAGITQGWPIELQKILNSNSSTKKFKIYNLARPGVSSDYLVEKFEEFRKKNRYDIVISMMGINDFGQERSCNYEDKIFNIKNHETISPQLNPDLATQNKAEELIKQALTYMAEGNITKAEKLVKESIKLNPNNEQAYIELSYIYNYNSSLSLSMLYKALEINSNNIQALTLLGQHYLNKNESEKGFRLFETSSIVCPSNPFIYQGLLNLRKSVKNDKYKMKINLLIDKMDNYRNTYSSNKTKANYNKLFNLIEREKKLYVVMQYPTLSIEPIKDFFSEEDQKNIIFISNKENFQEALKNENYNELFIDNFGLNQGINSVFYGKFGHTTAKGSKLIAENVANIILEHLNMTIS